MTLQDMIKVVQMETKSGSEARIKPEDWVRWAQDAITEAFAVDGALRIQSDLSITSTPYYVDPSADPTAVPNPYDLPGSLLPYHIGLESYIKFRYHSTSPKNEEEGGEAAKAYGEFLRCLGVQQQAAPAARG